METEYHMEKQELIIPMPKELDHHAAKTLGREIDFLVDSWQIKKLVLDFAETQFMDSSGIAFILRAQQRMRLLEGSLLVCHVPEQARRVLDAAGIGRLVTIR